MNKGYTLIELVVVIIIISVLSLITIPIYGNYVSRTKETVVKMKMSSVIEITNSYIEDLRFWLLIYQ